MVLRYSMPGTHLARREIAQSGGEVARPEKSISSRKKRVRFCLLLLANVIVWTLVYNLWAGEKNSRIWEFLTTNRGVVTGIMYDSDNSCAIVHGEVVHEGDTVNGYRVVKIHRDKVELERNGKCVTKRVQ